MHCGMYPGKENSSARILLPFLHYKTKSSSVNSEWGEGGRKEAISTTSLRALMKFIMAGGRKVWLCGTYFLRNIMDPQLWG